MTATGEHTGGDPYRYRPDLDPANVGVPSWVYLVHLDPPIEHTEIGPHAGAAHYTGSADDLPARTDKHDTNTAQVSASSADRVAECTNNETPVARGLGGRLVLPEFRCTCPPDTPRGTPNEQPHRTESKHSALWLDGALSARWLLAHEFRHAVLAGLASVLRVPEPKHSTRQKPGREPLGSCRDCRDDVLRFTADTSIVRLPDRQPLAAASAGILPAVAVKPALPVTMYKRAGCYGSDSVAPSWRSTPSRSP